MADTDDKKDDMPIIDTGPAPEGGAEHPEAFPPGCPVAEHMPRWVEDAVRSVDGVGDVVVNMVFEPPWDPSRMSDEARVALNMF